MATSTQEIIKYHSISDDGHNLKLGMSKGRTYSGLYSTRHMLGKLETSAVVVPTGISPITSNYVEVTFAGAHLLEMAFTKGIKTINTSRLITSLIALHNENTSPTRNGTTFALNFTHEDLCVVMENGIPELLMMMPPVRRLKADAVVKLSDMKSPYFIPPPEESCLLHPDGDNAVKCTIELMLGLLRDACAAQGYVYYSSTQVSTEPLDDESGLEAVVYFNTDIRTNLLSRLNAVQQSLIEKSEELDSRKRKVARVFVEREAKLQAPSYGTSAGHNMPGPMEDITLEPGTSIKYNSRLRCSVPDGHMLLITPRSSATARGIHVTGVVDVGYSGIITICVWNISSQPIEIKAGTSVAQMIFTKISNPVFEEVDEVDDLYPDGTERGDKCNGSAGNSIAK